MTQSQTAIPARAMPLLVGLIGLLLTAVATVYVSYSNTVESSRRFDRWVQQAEDDILDRVDRYIAVLKGAAAFMSAAPKADAATFRAYVDKLQVPVEYPGVQGIGFTRVFPAGELASFEAEMRRQGLENFRVWPDEPRSMYSAIAYIQPLDRRNRAALGYDMMNEPVRRAAMERARDTGAHAATAQVTLVQEIDEVKQAGFLIYVPVYSAGPVPTTVEERRQRLIGFAYAPFRVDDLLAGIFHGGGHPYVFFEIHDGAVALPEKLIHRSDAQEKIRRARHTTVRTMDVAGTPWTLTFGPRPEFDSALMQQAFVASVFGGGMVVTGILVLLMRREARARYRAEESARELSRSQQSVREAEERYRLVNLATNDVIWDWRLDTQQLLWNDALQRVFGYDPADVEPTIQWWEQRVHPEDRQRVLAHVHAAIDSRRDTWTDEYRFECADGRYASVIDRGFVLRDARGTAVRMIGSMMDLTERLQREHELKRLNETLEERVEQRHKELVAHQQRLRSLASQLTMTEHRERRRLAQILHDHLQQLLVAAMMRMNLMKKKAATPDTADSAGQVIDLLNRSIEASRSLTVELSPPVLYDAGLVAGLNWLVSRMKDKYGLTVELEADPDAEPEGEELRVLVFNAVQELLFNIVKHAGVDRAYVTLMRVNRQSVQLTVEDEGRGFDQKAALEQSVAQMGYGLFNLTERLVSFGAKMTIESAPNEGTCVQITLPAPLAEEPKDDAPAAAPVAADAGSNGHDTSAASTGGKIRVLLADDHKILRDGLASLLREEPDIEVIGEAPDGQVALDLARRTHPEVVIMDVTMPNMNGIEATRRLSAEMPTVRVIGLSMHDDANLASAMREAGAVAYLPKDGPSHLLISTIRSNAPIHH